MRAKLVFLAAAAMPALAYGQTLQEAMITAYGSNPTLEAERESARGVDERLAGARGAFLPTLTFGANAGRQVQESSGVRVFGGVPFTSDSTTRGYNYGLDVTLRQDLWTSGRNVGQLGQARSAVLAARAGLEAVEQSVMLDVVTAFVDVRSNQEQLRIRANNVEVLTKQLQAARDRFTVGEITRTDVAQAEARLSGAQSALAAAQAQLDTAKSEYEQIVGNRPGELAAPPPVANLPKTLDDAIAVAQEANPALLQARFALKGQEQGVKVARAALLPQVSLTGSINRDQNRGELTTRAGGTPGNSATASLSRGASIGGAFSVPLFDGGVARAATRQARIGVLESKAREEVARRQVVQQATSAWANYVSSLAQIESSRQQVKANEVAFEGVSQELQVGLRTTLDVLDAEQELLNSRLALVQADRNAYVAANVLLASTGQLTAEDLRLDTPIYDEAAYGEAVKLGLRAGWLGTTPPKTEDNRPDLTAKPVENP